MKEQNPQSLIELSGGFIAPFFLETPSHQSLQEVEVELEGWFLETQ